MPGRVLPTSRVMNGRFWDRPRVSWLEQAFEGEGAGHFPARR